MHTGEPGAESDEHEQTDLHRGHWNAHGACAFLIAAYREDPVTDARLEQHPCRDGGEQQPPEHGDPNLDTEDWERGREHLLSRIPALHVVDARRCHLTRNELG